MDARFALLTLLLLCGLCVVAAPARSEQNRTPTPEQIDAELERCRVRLPHDSAPLVDSEAESEPSTALATELTGGTSETEPPRPWANGVSLAEQEYARALFYSGNEQIGRGDIRQARELYRTALTHWGHPAIHYNLAIATFRLVQPLDTLNELWMGMMYCGAALDPEHYRTAQNYLVLVRRQLAWLEVQCVGGDPEDARVAVDDKPVATGDGRYSGYQMAGKHTIRAAKPRFVEDERNLQIVGGEHASVKLGLFTSDELTVRRSPTMLSVSLMGIGALVALGGGVALIGEDINRDKAFDYTMQCSDTLKCRDELRRGIETRGDRAELLKVIGISALGVGGTALVTGAVLWLASDAFTHRISPEQKMRNAGLVSVMPNVDATHATIQVAGTF